MSRSKSSQRWLQEHFKDPYAQQAKQEGFRSRAVYKLQAIQAQDKILQPGMLVIDLGAAPGGWAQYAATQIAGGSRFGQVIALDILPMNPIPDVQFIQGDFREQTVLEQLLATLNQRPVDLVISDMAPNISGISAVDQPRAMYLAELALELAKQVLKPSGNFLLKVFEGEGLEAYRTELKATFAQVVSRKPDASRARSREYYILAKNYRLR